MDAEFVETSTESDIKQHKLNRRERRRMKRQGVVDAFGNSPTATFKNTQSVPDKSASPPSLAPVTTARGSKSASTDSMVEHSQIPTQLAQMERRLDTVERLLAHMAGGHSFQDKS